MQKELIKNIIFDLGNVIINIDPARTVCEMKGLGFKDFDKSYSLLNQTHLFDLLEKGKIRPEDFHREINNQLEKEVSADLIDMAWGAMLLDFPKKRIELLQNLKKNYRLFLLSNTNEIHYHQYNNYLINQYGFGLSNLFEKAYYSHEIGMRKPDPKIFKYVLNNGKLNPTETLFIDDLYQNIDVARKLGLETIWIEVERGDDITTKLNGF